ncbi:solute carrier family 35 member F6-like [Anneissia japonica]|uniref:solute carrier family 35 member F6-like n=1 Tax=Anneissia japonica TaxID=1529436 RepID=UPI00142554CF|nr:solute carrier family 35 member F6-like [Anneissia japonica]
MAWTSYQYSLAVLMLVTGSINTISTKWADLMTSPGREGDTSRKFDHPFLQACGMFLGEMACLLTFKLVWFYKQRKGKHYDVGPQEFTPFVMLPPALCDMCGTSIMYVGLTLTYASSFQMLRGSVIIFTGLLSVAFLGRKLQVHHWLGMFLVLIGLVLVGVADIVFKEKDSKDLNNIITGDLLIIMAQIITAVQMVIEEKFLSKYKIPALQAVGWEGLFGFCVLSVLLVPFFYIHVGSLSTLPEHRLEDAIDGFIQLGNNKLLIVAFLGNMISIAFFNFSGISVTKEMSATTRMVLDSLRTLVIWCFSLAVGWEKFSGIAGFLQLLGFVILVSGTCVYNNAVCVPLYERYKQKRNSLVVYNSDEQKPILDHGSIQNAGSISYNSKDGRYPQI